MPRLIYKKGKKMKNAELVYPSFSKKALSFTIDDGNMVYDEIFLGILKPAGIKGTFNLCSNIHKGKEEMTRLFYQDYEIANHVKYHPFVNFDGAELVISDDEFDEKTADPGYLYRVKGREGFFWQIKPNGWRQMVFVKDFIRYSDEGLRELNEMFSEGSVKDYVWPYGEQNNRELMQHIKKTHRYVRKTGCTLDTTGFSVPEDKLAWSYNANHMNLLEVMQKYESYPDDGELKFFAFGVHAIDFERDGKWDDLKEFAAKYGNRPSDYWYAAVGEIFEYEEAASRLVITEDSVKNPSALKIYMKIDGVNTVIEPFSELSLKE